jgi:FAD/FMN-containing dehydrogenase
MLDKLRGIVGPAHVLTGVDCGPYVVDGRTPEAVALPGTKEEVAACLLAAAAAEMPVTPWGGGTKMGIGNPPQRLGLVLALKRLNRLLEHEPGDLTATVEAGIPLSALQRALGERGQWLSLDPAHADVATLGGILSTNAAGPRRHLYGSCRDLLIGVTVVTAAGALVKGGGKVVKNVAGYDLARLVCGSEGRLAFVVRASFKLHPLPRAARTLLVETDDTGLVASRLLGSQLQPSALDVLHPGRVAVLFEGSSRAVDSQFEQAVSLVGGRAAGEEIWEEARRRQASAGGRVHFAPRDLGLALLSCDEAVIRPAAGVAYGLARIQDDTPPDVRRLFDAIREQLDPSRVLAA